MSSGPARKPAPGGAREIRRRALWIFLAFLSTQALLVGFTWVELHALGGAAAYIRGESIWSKRQKDACIWLQAYARDGRPESFERYRDSLTVILADREARLALVADPPRLDDARRAFLRGGNRPEDIDDLIRLFRARGLSAEMRAAIAAWEDADALVDELRVLADRIGAHGAAADEAGLERDLRALLRLNDELSILEARFSDRIQEAMDWLQERIFLAHTILSVLLVLVVAWLGWRLLIDSARTRRGLATSERRYRAMAENSFAGIWQTDLAGRTLYANPALARMLEVDDPARVEGESWLRWFTAEGLSSLQREQERWARGESSLFEMQLLGGKGNSHTVIFSAAPVLDEDGYIESIIATVVDITQRKAMLELLEHQSLHDPLTELPNRILFLDRLKNALARSRRNGHTVAVLYLDLDRFKSANDYYGHEIGDSLLLSFGQRLVESMREEDTVARLGGDEFAVLMEGVEDDQEAIECADRIGGIVQFPLDLDGSAVRLSASIGVAMSRGEPMAPEDLLRQADIAMFAAKQQGVGRHHLYDHEHDHRATRRFQIEKELWDAVEGGQLALFYQPIVDLASGRVAGCEALVRWEHPERGIISPAEFIPVAEENGAILPIGRWVIREAMQQQQLWRVLFGREQGFFMGINLSSMQFRLSELPEEIAHQLRESGLPPSSLHFEITESLLLQAPAAVRRLKNLGVHVSIDDFGTGYSSLGTLKKITVDSLKVDKGFVAGLGRSSEDTALVTASLDMARALNLQVIAEGVEDESQLEHLRRLGCDMGQGYLFSRPLPAPQFEKLLEAVPAW